MYFEKTEDKLIKYNVTLDIEGLERIKDIIIDNCSKIKHRTMETTELPNFYNFKYIRNFKKKFVRMQDFNDIYYESKEVYYVEYDEYTPPKLVYYIDELIKGNYSVIFNIMNPKEEIIDYTIEKEKIITEMQSLVECNLHESLDEKRNIGKKLSLLQKKLNEVSKEEILNSEQSSVLGYYLLVQNLITLEKIEELSIEEFAKVVSFFSEKIDCQKVLKRII